MNKLILITILSILTIIVLTRGFNYQERINEYGTHVCAVNGYEPDCKTKLGGE